MKALITANGFVIAEASRIDYGIYDEPNVNKWALYDEDDSLMYYVLGSDYELIEYDEDDRPADYAAGKYLYIDGEWVLNEDYTEPPLTIEQKVQLHGEAIAELSDENEELSVCMADMLIDICNLQLGI